MAVIINDWDTVVHGPSVPAEPQGPATTPGAWQPAERRALRPLDIDDLLRRRAGRLARRQAH